MTVAILLLLVLIGLGLHAWRWRRLGIACMVVAALLLVAAGCGPLPAWLLGRLQDGFATQVNGWGQRNAIILLGAGTVRAYRGRIEPGVFANGRMLRATMLYRACKATGAECRIEISGGDAKGLGVPEAAAYAAVLRGLGVPRGDLLLEPRSMNTWQNAQFSAPLLRAYGADRVLLVSSASHLRRASLYFRHFGVVATPVRADYLRADLSWLPLAWNLALTDLALHEYLGIARYHVYQALGWNVRAARPGAP
jgi:uncharacterized SAM-binding protein YcdF (DUF218 family)